MSQESSIEWTDATWNPVRGCTKISPGCKHCYAETFAERWRGVPGHPYEQGFDLRLVPEKLTEPLKWKKPRVIFVNSMSDLFHEDVPDSYIDKVFAVMALCPHHTFQVLTKRADRMAEYLNALGREDAIDDIACDMREEVKHWQDFAVDWVRLGRGGYVDMPLDNVWLGVSVENKQHGLPRIEHLLKTPAAVRFLSIEPLLEDLGEVSGLPKRRCDSCYYDGGATGFSANATFANNLCPRCGASASQFDKPAISWVIVGGESGHGARPMHPDWVRSIRDQCVAAGVPFFFKQWGEWVESLQVGGNGWVLGREEGGKMFGRLSASEGRPHAGGTIYDGPSRQLFAGREFETRFPWGEVYPCMVKLGKKSAGRILDGRTWDEMPKRETVSA
ncbi:MAG TPA: phage Gp37/Gp68 family protein [Gemmataceae bacterium]|nr:phage Gp37/Gp68 family protein [Gemmataceae bacterium]